MVGLVSHSADDLVEDDNHPDGVFDGFELVDMIAAPISGCHLRVHDNEWVKYSFVIKIPVFSTHC